MDKNTVNQCFCYWCTLQFCLLFMFSKLIHVDVKKLTDGLIVWLQDNNRSEMKRLDSERQADFVNMLKGFVTNQVLSSLNLYCWHVLPLKSITYSWCEIVVLTWHSKYNIEKLRFMCFPPCGTERANLMPVMHDSSSSWIMKFYPCDDLVNLGFLFI